jgi:DNA-binding MarR family transcriptional regulator
MHMQQPPIKLPQDPIQRAWVAVQRYGPNLLERVECKVREAGFPPLEWYDVLWAIEREGPLRQRDLANHMLIARYSISRLIDRMEAEGLVERRECPNDARGQMIHCTDAGLALRKQIWGAYGPAMREALGGLTEDEAVQLAALLVKIG